MKFETALVVIPSMVTMTIALTFVLVYGFKATPWYARIMRRRELRTLIEFGSELTDSLEYYTTGRTGDEEFKSYLNSLVVKYTYAEYTDGAMALKMEKMWRPRDFLNTHHVPMASIFVPLPTLRLALLVIDDDTLVSMQKVEIIKLAELSAFNCLNDLYKELENL